jgi:cytosine/adenosine deaminase-related metal-dependent hydrolase
MKLVYLPLDSRPCNALFPIQLSALRGVIPLAPPREAMDFFRTPAPSGPTLDWLARETQDADALVLAVDHLCFGSLLASREDDVTESMHSMDNYYVSKLIPLMREAQVSAIANPLINITIQGRHDTYPKRRGMTRVPELMAAGIRVAFGHDCAMDPWYPLGSADMLEVAAMGLHVAQMTGQEAMRACFDAVTTHPAGILGLDDYGIAPGCRADFVLLQARDAITSAMPSWARH